MLTLTEDLICLYAARIGSRVQPRDTQQRWTRATKEILTAFATDRGWTCICTSVRNHEFLLDFIAVHPDTADVQLAVESEWGPLGAIVHDFRKLLYMKSDVKIMICGSGGERLLPRLEEIASKYPRHMTGETYIILDVSEPEMCVHSYMWAPETDGVAAVQFRPLLEPVPFAFVVTAAS